MTTIAAKQGDIGFPGEWEQLESSRFGPFINRTVHRLPDGTIDVRTSRRHRKNLGPEPSAETAEKQRPTLFLWRPHSLNWWIAVLFMIGSWHFVSGSILVLVGSPYVYLIDLIYFTGSLFFTSAGYLQYYQAINAPDAIDEDGRTVAPTRRRYLAWMPNSMGFWASFPQFLGTLAFNVTTLTAFLDVEILGYDLLVWIPDYVGSILFLVSGFAAVFEYCNWFWCWKNRDFSWWIVMINWLGCVFFMVSAFAAFVRPRPLFDNLATWATITTLLGAACFFAGAYLMWPEMASDEEAVAVAIAK